MEKQEKIFEVFMLPSVPVKPMLAYDVEEMRALYYQIKSKDEVIFGLQKERSLREIELANTVRFNMIKRNHLAEEIQNLERKIEDPKLELTIFIKHHGFENAAVFMKQFKEIKGKVDGYNKDVTAWKQMKQQVEVMNQMLVRGEITKEYAE